jgi:hypothetical protein
MTPWLFSSKSTSEDRGRGEALCTLPIQRPTLRLSDQPTHEQQYDEDDQDDADHTYAVVTEAVATFAADLKVIYYVGPRVEGL